MAAAFYVRERGGGVAAMQSTSGVQEHGGGAQVCVLSCVYRGSLCSVRSGSVCARCLWVILSGYIEPLLRVNRGSLAALGDCNCRLWQAVALLQFSAAAIVRTRFEFPNAYPTASAGGRTPRALAGEARKTRTLSSKQGIGAQNERHSFDSAAVTRLTALPDWPASPASKKQNAPRLGGSKSSLPPIR